jgi:transposase
MLILAIDLGMSNSVVCRFDTVGGEYSFGKIATDSAELRALFVQTAWDLIVVESGSLAALVHDVATEAGRRIVVADTTRDAWRWRNVKRKTDQDDALKLARLAALDQINPVHIPDHAARQVRQLIELRRQFVQERTRCKCRIRDLLRRQAELRLKRGCSGWTIKEQSRLDGLRKELASCDPDHLWRGALDLLLHHLSALDARVLEVDSRLNQLGRKDARVRRLQTLPGVGPRVAEIIVNVLDQPQRFQSPRQVGAYAGLTPRQYDSGESQRSGRISKRGNPLLRHALNQAAWKAVQIDPHFRKLFQQLCRGSRKRAKIAIVAVMRRLLIIAWAMLRDEQSYRPTARAA